MGHELPRRSLLNGASATAAAVLAGCLSSAREEQPSEAAAGENETSDEHADCARRLPGADDEVVVRVGPDGRQLFAPNDLHVRTGATVRFEWATGGHDLHVRHQPADADWEGVPEAAEAGHVHEHAFEWPGHYRAEATTHEVPMPFDLQVGPHGRPYDGEHPTDAELEIHPVDWTDREEATIHVGPDHQLVFDPEAVAVTPGTTLTFEWHSDNHTVSVVERPSDAEWGGVSEVHHAGFSHEQTFTVPGTYRFVCEPHRSAGMTGAVVVIEE